MGWPDCPKSPSRIHDRPIALEPGNHEKGCLSTHPQHLNNRSQDISSWASTRTEVHNSRPRYLFSKTHDLSSTDHDLRNIYQDPFLQETFLFLYAVLELFFFASLDPWEPLLVAIIYLIAILDIFAMLYLLPLLRNSPTLFANLDLYLSAILDLLRTNLIARILHRSCQPWSFWGPCSLTSSRALISSPGHLLMNRLTCIFPTE